ncbi:MAG: hypothetical protein ACYTGH_04615, partial [Planctomycetota bacterium]
MTRTPHPLYGDERQQDMAGCVAPQVRLDLETLKGCRVDLIRSTAWECFVPWYVPRRVLPNDFLLFVLDGALEVETPRGRDVLTRGMALFSPAGDFHSYG